MGPQPTPVFKPTFAESQGHCEVHWGVARVGLCGEVSAPGCKAEQALGTGLGDCRTEVPHHALQYALCPCDLGQWQDQGAPLPKEQDLESLGHGRGYSTWLTGSNTEAAHHLPSLVYPGTPELLRGRLLTQQGLYTLHMVPTHRVE